MNPIDMIFQKMNNELEEILSSKQPENNGNNE